ncbi:hypothetical protein DYI24_00350 [Rhodopseudomonas sp. BR0C11]|uniref:hypothetical protein n=1 Tax=Rhodopseudomonas sp. BR0C11 TaxID=2269370 RepID=UPI0013DED89E|nr:hypothetical protein [Rhodopseudomonas sp. BR0C11]NEV75532.1 hypothetical protein [Rhodopseudomonas sp. BR0C11]
MTDTSYPFLRVAREQRIPYRDVLAYRDAVLKLSGMAEKPSANVVDDYRWDYWEAAAVRSLRTNEPARAAIIDAIMAESARRARVMFNDGLEG